MNIRRSDGGRRLGRRIEHFFKNIIWRVLGFFTRNSQTALRDLPELRSILIVRPNFRLGNVLISARLIPALHERFPGARIDFLGTSATCRLLEHTGLNRIYALDRLMLLKCWQMIGMILDIRRQKYDAAMLVGHGSFSSILLAMLSGATYRIGSAGHPSDCVLNLRLDVKSETHSYDNMRAFIRALGVDAASRPYYVVSAEEHANATAWLISAGFADAKKRNFIAVFAGGRLDKRMPGDFWLSYLQHLSRLNVIVLLFTGPEEAELIERIKSQRIPGLTVAPPLPIRRVAALCACATLVVSPDTGTMHLAAALDLPVISILNTEKSRRYAPAGQQDLVLMQPSPDQAADVTVRVIRSYSASVFSTV